MYLFDYAVILSGIPYIFSTTQTSKRGLALRSEKVLESAPRGIAYEKRYVQT